MIHLSPAAVSEIRRLKSRHPNPQAFFRLGIQPGGCSDFYYTLEFDEAPAPEDQVWESNDIQVLVNAKSRDYISGLRLDYSEDLMGGGFRFHNPNAAESCGCGNSFSLGDRP